MYRWWTCYWRKSSLSAYACIRMLACWTSNSNRPWGLYWCIVKTYTPWSLALVRRSWWLVAVASPALQRMYTHTLLFLITCPSSVNLVNSIKCVDSYCSYHLYHRLFIIHSWWCTCISNHTYCTSTHKLSFGLQHWYQYCRCVIHNVWYLFLLKSTRTKVQNNSKYSIMYIHVHVCTFVSRTSVSKLISLRHIACSNTDGCGLILHTLDCDDCTILCVHTVEHTKRVEKLLKIATKCDVTSNHHNTLDCTKWPSKTALLHGWMALVTMQLGNYGRRVCM